MALQPPLDLHGNAHEHNPDAQSSTAPYLAIPHTTFLSHSSAVAGLFRRTSRYGNLAAPGLATSNSIALVSMLEHDLFKAQSASNSTVLTSGARLAELYTLRVSAAVAY